ncbi:hypothetical protein KZJ38_07230 [Paraburkholderia edwinii]|uniref:Uncharacterized protein n=1 Tax=Paraburkholderia edwinii TaxID=2861782 RepID=A0ABX8UM86_9BURK|nr:hypothetical protein [Paraburkholderia edwinii]QYD70097.1 hypothetical protein KZJ38_07230 [Paraburkholderia edwinii]
MRREYDYRQFIIEVDVEAQSRLPADERMASLPGFVAIVQVLSKGSCVPLMAPMKLGDVTGSAFPTQADALMSGCAAGQRLVDDLLAGDGAISGQEKR